MEICKWYNNADAPVLFFIDDLANVWVDTNGNGKIDLGEDWGYAKDSENSSFKYLNDMILKEFPYVKTTFFVPVGVRVGMIENPKIKSISKMINCDEETKKFFKSINDNPKYEIAYHGTTHGKVGKTIFDFKQEWELFNSTEEAIQQINEGKEVYKDVFGCYPIGGKYCGYVSNKFSDKSIDSTEFLWWSRYWNRGVCEKCEDGISGGDSNSITNFDIKTFGKNSVIDIPSTINGGLFSGIFNTNLKSLKGILKIILRKYLIKRKSQQIEYLMQNNLVISIQEHIAPSRDDGRRQTPNIFDDKESLYHIFRYLKDKNVWYCTGTELAEYYYLRNNILVEDIDDKSFRFIYTGNKNIMRKKLTIKLYETIDKIIQPDGKVVYNKNNYFNLDVIDGIYHI
ncbi:hypothetical protein Z968_11685 [Clostridium novyi A str. 4552]|uniref:Uncharacterized protein n=1 Tax=Clostridium novyi A str. 4552 TaxID=1444289 RepID=A0A0A0HZ83_CLONO|nr:hypothetical protein Z968_11685 [Clostridium novyi A str. 4552]